MDEFYLGDVEAYRVWALARDYCLRLRASTKESVDFSDPCEGQGCRVLGLEASKLTLQDSRFHWSSQAS